MSYQVDVTYVLSVNVARILLSVFNSDSIYGDMEYASPYLLDKVYVGSIYQPVSWFE